ncbi:MAG: sulfate permease [Clostridia bacterium]|nr:sulfate permease [Clostridia bacterium]
MKLFQPKLITSMKDYSGKKLINDLIAGLIVAIIALPLSIALAIASGVTPERGLYTAIVAGLVIALLGGSRVNISGPTAAFATIVAGIVATHGMSGLAVATLMAGVILILMGICRFGSLIKFIPYTITTGFTAGIAVTIIIGQIKDFMGLTFAPGTHAVETVEKVTAIGKSITTLNWQAILVGAVCLAILIVWPKINKRIPPSLLAVVAGILMVKLLPMEVNTIGDLFEIPRSLPPFEFPKFSFETVKTLLPDAFTIAILAAIESLLSCVVSDGMIGDRHNSNTELIAQGAGNICSSLFGGIPATGAIARTAANVKNGGRTPIAGIVHALVLLLVLVLLMPYAAWIPMPTIAAILFMVAYNMSEWRHFVKICKTAPLSDILVLVLTFLLTVIFDLVVAIAVGLLLAAILFIKKMIDVTNIRPWTAADERSESDGGRLKSIPDRVAVFELNGPMFFASADKFHFPMKDGDRVMILRMRNVPSLDGAAVESLMELVHTCRSRNMKLLISHVNEQPLAVMKRSGFYDAVGAENFMENIDEALKKARTLCEKSIETEN